MKLRSRFFRHTFACLLIVAGLVEQTRPIGGQNYFIDRYTIQGSTGISSEGLYSLSGSFRSTDSGPMTAGSFSMNGRILSLVAAAASLDAPELIVNGSFENTAGTFVDERGGIMSLFGDSTVIPGWTVTTRELAWLSNGAVDLVSRFGDFFLDLTGYLHSGPYGGLTQTIATSPGQTYRLSLALGLNTFNSAFQGPKSVLVAAGSATNVLTYDSAGPGNQWGVVSWDFVAESASTPVTITGIVAGGNEYIGLDNVSVTRAASPLVLNIAPLDISRNELSFSFRGRPGRTYEIEGVSDLAAAVWATVPNLLKVGQDGVIRAGIPATKPRQFYRLKELPEPR